MPDGDVVMAAVNQVLAPLYIGASPKSYRIRARSSFDRYTVLFTSTCQWEWSHSSAGPWQRVAANVVWPLRFTTIETVLWFRCTLQEGMLLSATTSNLAGPSGPAGTPGPQGAAGPAGPTTGAVIVNLENRSGTTILAGQPVAVRVAGGCVLAQANGVGARCVALAQSDTPVLAAVPAVTKGLLTLDDWSLATGYVSLTPGAAYYLDDNAPGGITSTAPTTSGSIVQKVADAVSSDTLLIDPQAPTLL